MDYNWHYNRLIETRKDRKLDDLEYYEIHHIQMKSMGGAHDESNLIRLTAREHFLAHWLLWRIHRNRQTAYAFNTFCNFFDGHNHSNRPKITSSRGYKEAREAYAKIHSESMKGVLNSNRSKKVLQFDTDGNYIREWSSAAEIKRELGIWHVTTCCRGEREWAGGFKWKYKNPILKKSKKYEYKNDKKTGRKAVSQYSLDGEKIADYGSLGEAQDKTGIPRSTIQRHLCGLNKSAWKYIWKIKN